jgi:hypothetical protein
MGSVRVRDRAAWKAHGRDLFSIPPGIPDVSGFGTAQPGLRVCAGVRLGGTVSISDSDLFYIGMTIVAFAVLYLILKGVERFER